MVKFEILLFSRGVKTALRILFASNIYWEPIKFYAILIPLSIVNRYVIQSSHIICKIDRLRLHYSLQHNILLTYKLYTINITLLRIERKRTKINVHNDSYILCQLYVKISKFVYAEHSKSTCKPWSILLLTHNFRTRVS